MTSVKLLGPQPTTAATQMISDKLSKSLMYLIELNCEIIQHTTINLQIGKCGIHDNQPPVHQENTSDVVAKCK